MPLYDYRIAKTALSEGEKDRILAVYLNTTADASSVIDWETATTHYGSRSVDSMKDSIRKIHRKLAKAGAKRETMGDKSPSGSLKIKLAATGSKRKPNCKGSGEAAKAKRGRPSKKKVAVAEAVKDVAEAVEDAGEKVEVKEEKVKEE
ncbi:hypothetical protein SMMN14_05781 [Sphaerulina musiva]